MSDKKKTCSLCRAKTSGFKETLYGATICQKCHNILIEYGIRPKEEVDEMVQREENRVKKYMENFTRTLSHRKPYSEERKKIGKTATTIGFFVFCITWYIGIKEFIKALPFPNEMSSFEATLYYLCSMAPLIPLFLSLIIGNFYIEMMKRYRRNLIEEELEKDEIKIKEEIVQIINREQIKTKRRARLSRLYLYQKTIHRAEEKKILLWEYFLGDYPPDWKYRSQITRNRDGNCCRKCRKRGVLHVHHIDLVKRGGVSIGYGLFRVKTGGNHFLDNLITLCSDCHLKEHPYLLKEIRGK